MAVRKTMRDFALWTSASGVPHIGRAQSNCMRIFWFVVFLACLVMFTFQMYMLVMNYLAYNVIVNTKLEFRSLNFPAVTICNLNPYKKSKVMEKDQLKTLIAAYQAAINRTLQADDIWGFTALNDTMAIQAKARDHMMYLVAQMTPDEKQSISYDKSEFVLGCAFDSTKQCVDDFTTNNAMDQTYGQCFKFNDPAKYMSQRAGPRYGVRVFLATDLSEYLEITESAGVRVTVTGQGEGVFPDAFGYNAAAGFTTSFGLQYVETKRMGQPYGNCTPQSSTVYSVEGCFRQCLQDYLSETCGCCDPAFNCTNPNYKYCNNSKLACISQATGSGSKNATSGFNAATRCTCPELCQEAAYSMTVSTGNWPSGQYIPDFCKDKFDDDTLSDQQQKDLSHAWCNQNTMMVEIYFERMNFQSLSESEAYPFVSLISDFGGQIGLWIGVSVITVVEFIFFPLLLCAACCCKPDKNRKSALDEYDEEDNEFDKIGIAGSKGPPPPYPGATGDQYNSFNNNPMRDPHHHPPGTGRGDPYSGMNQNFEMPPSVAR